MRLQCAKWQREVRRRLAGALKTLDSHVRNHLEKQKSRSPRTHSSRTGFCRPSLGQVEYCKSHLVQSVLVSTAAPRSAIFEYVDFSFRFHIRHLRRNYSALSIGGREPDDLSDIKRHSVAIMDDGRQDSFLRSRHMHVWKLHLLAAFHHTVDPSSRQQRREQER